MKRGRPPIAPHTSQIPATTVPASWHDAVAREAVARDVPVAQVVREAIFCHLKNRQTEGAR